MKRIALINDLSGFGRCSLTAAIPVISVMGLQACPLPTAVLSAQTGFDSYFFDDYSDRMNTITDEWAKMDVRFDGICSGYLGSPAQVERVGYFLDRFKNEDNIFLADPVIGDNGRCIKSFTDEFLASMRELTRRADIITPNLTELCLLAGADYSKLVEYKGSADYQKRIADVAEKVRAVADVDQTVIVTGVIRDVKPPVIGNLVADAAGFEYYEGSYTGKSFSGTGDLFAAVVIGDVVSGASAGEAVRKAMSFLQPAIEEASAAGTEGKHGVYFEKYLSLLK